MSPILPHPINPEARALIFDCDGTLLDSMPAHFKAWSITAAMFGINITARRMVELAGMPIHELIEVFAKESNVELTEDLRQNFFAAKSKYYLEHDDEVAIIQPVFEIVKMGKELGLKMAVCSGGTKHHVMKGLTASGLLPYFDAIVTGEDVQKGKPSPDGFLLAAKQLGIDPMYCVGYEDAKLGMEAIRSANFLEAVDVTVFDNYPHMEL
mmetsp:Transcript_33793/g.61017  ORF Transcript_33793/g.61017 Transcript_33793/m.61017 type:complete len:210 (-) Transcript_33793:555-1184(-)|eukprot:CAMPEP_0175040006 /NCGR_PEP_ID=MMETSP0052_2-20121109/979_1 /TAXON_ID=51329 ORGANISM="Polytomella parva, Strain SAG 63-3" /NCGR_SAMPLE_ID=MMETSP0052_2 /ASSEMBLY_ACC=CAM_ASM_000194 /LENGTH=209 /DNA_ID=CAMNT_0016302081 /DNA_START=55 /DNA_END=684 /DNA_ORIENTATION=+